MYPGCFRSRCEAYVKLPRDLTVQNCLYYLGNDAALRTRRVYSFGIGSGRIHGHVEYARKIAHNKHGPILLFIDELHNLQATTEASKSPKSVQDDMSTYASIPLVTATSEGADGRKVSSELTPGRGNRFATVALALAAQKAQARTSTAGGAGQTGSFMSGQSPPASTRSDALGRASNPFSRPAVQSQSDLLSFSANHEKHTDIKLQTLRWRNNARTGAPQHNPSDSVGSGTVSVLEGTQIPLNPPDGFATVSQDSAKAEGLDLPLATDIDMQPQVVVVTPDSTQVPAPEAQDGLNLQQTPKHTPFDGTSEL